MRRVRCALRAPIDDYLAALEVCLAGRLPGKVALVAVVLVLSWWVYVPVHELGHAAGCVLTGGEVTRLEISPVYGAALLKKVFPFVAVGSAYAGQLTGFDTHGNDLTYLATDFFPFLLTIFLGVPLLRKAGAAHRRPLRGCVMLGAALPVAYAPFVSLLGDYYEMGSIVVSRLAVWLSPGLPIDRWRSDDAIKLGTALFGSGAGPRVADVLGFGTALLLGVSLAWVTYGLGAFVADGIGGDRTSTWRMCSCGRSCGGAASAGRSSGGGKRDA